MPMLKESIRAIKDVFVPALCFYCEKRIHCGYLCLNCRQKIEFLYPPLCRLCSKKIEKNTSGLCKECRANSFAYDRVISVTAYKEPLVSLIHLFKYKSYDYLGEFFASLMTQHFSKIGFSLYNYATITCVPMHTAKLRDRGYNQAAILAKLLANYFKIPYKDDIIYESKERISQTQIDKQNRKVNVRDVFLVKDTASGENIILVDDIFTTGSTVNACAGALKEKGAKAITVITLSKAQ